MCHHNTKVLLRLLFGNEDKLLGGIDGGVEVGTQEYQAVDTSDCCPTSSLALEDISRHLLRVNPFILFGWDDVRYPALLLPSGHSALLSISKDCHKRSVAVRCMNTGLG